MVNESIETRPAIFLDTNAIHYAISYLQIAQQKSLPPFSELHVEDVKERLSQNRPPSIVNYLMNGCKTLAFLQEQARQGDHGHDGALVFMSRLSKAEILHGTLDGKAHASMAAAGVSYRRRQSLRDYNSLVSMHLKPSDYENVLREVDDLIELLEENDDIHIEFVENSTGITVVQITSLAEFLQGRIFLDVIDCWIYAGALVAQVDQLITFDGSFREVINKTNNPGDDPNWQQMQSDLKEHLKGVFPGISPVLPASPGPPPAVPVLWSTHNP